MPFITFTRLPNKPDQISDWAGPFRIIMKVGDQFSVNKQIWQILAMDNTGVILEKVCSSQKFFLKGDSVFKNLRGDCLISFKRNTGESRGVFKFVVRPDITVKHFKIYVGVNENIGN